MNTTSREIMKQKCTCSNLHIYLTTWILCRLQIYMNIYEEDVTQHVKTHYEKKQRCSNTIIACLFKCMNNLCRFMWIFMS